MCAKISKDNSFIRHSATKSGCYNERKEKTVRKDNVMKTPPWVHLVVLPTFMSCLNVTDEEKPEVSKEFDTTFSTRKLHF